MQYGKLAGLLAAVGVAVGGGFWLSGQQPEGPAAMQTRAPQAELAQQARLGDAAAEGSMRQEGMNAAPMARKTAQAARPAAGKAATPATKEMNAATATSDVARQEKQGGKLAAAAVGSAEVSDADASRAAPATAQTARPQTGSVEVLLQTMGDVMATMGGTVARVADTFIVVLSGELEQTRKLAAGEGGNDLADVVRQMEAREELERPGLKGPIRRFMDKYCILGYLTGKGTCDR